ncbi:SHOCT domain-containing protein [Corynebacterium tuberculostearicum]|nr:SHOCT domain-containing protein [Corynebacterium tuberculostearicum]
MSEETGVTLGSVRISTSNDEIEVEKVATAEAKTLVSAARRTLEQNSAQSPAPAADDGLDKLQKLADLHAAGVLTDEEFASAKAKALGL